MSCSSYRRHSVKQYKGCLELTFFIVCLIKSHARVGVAFFFFITFVLSMINQFAYSLINQFAYS